MHLRRALLLFAIVLGLAAVAASVSRTDRSRPAPAPAKPQSSTETARPGTAPSAPRPAPDPGSRTLRFEQGGRPEVRKLAAGHAATVVVAVRSAGQAEIRGLEDSLDADPATPASFDVFRTQPGSFPVLFHPARGGGPERVGTLRVVPN